jgi:hypothetical protein
MTGIERRSASESFDLLRMDRQIQRRVAGRRAAKAAAMLGVVAVGLRRGGALGWAAAGLGLSVLAREVWGWLEARPEWRKRAPAHFRRMFNLNHDQVDVASAYSFPASDAPAPHDVH